MGSISKYPVGAGHRWEVRYRKPTGQQTRKRGFASKAAATAYLHQVETDKAAGTYVDPSRGRVTVTEWATLWLDGKANIATSTKSRYQSIIDTWITPTFGSTAVSSVRHIDVQAWVSGQDCSAASVVKNHRVLSQILELAVRDQRIPSNPARGVNLPRVKHAKRRYLTAAQVEELATAAEGWRPLVLLLAYTGLRWGEMAALQVADVDMLRRRLHVARAVTVVDGRFVWGEPKDHEQRWVPIPKSVAAELANHMAGKRRDDLVFKGERSGGPLRVKAARESWFDDAVVAAKCPDGLTPHELRHTAASLAISAGASVLAVQRMLGHAKASMTLDVYSDLFDDDLDSVATALDEIRRQAM
ncbi:tyrosine-type recombinase/integrase [Gordonia sp. N1V]|uniref:tyrosine-type recombinase/integrase n=1 Tax=Gordonia sp. N1V TaxID=3034163 RepID=UPI0023E2CFB0|nr:tyrosine-type recombinase/integrase [Gordonia sp. N1V]MDF3280441.1 tyrosine-type recombinase/integrase [Gordonia sp. N1V]